MTSLVDNILSQLLLVLQKYSIELLPMKLYLPFEHFASKKVVQGGRHFFADRGEREKQAAFFQG